MNDNNFFTNSKIQYVDQEQLKILAGTIRKYINDLNNIKTNADAIWEQSSTYLEDSALKGINTVKSDNNKKYRRVIFNSVIDGKDFKVTTDRLSMIV